MLNLRCDTAWSSEETGSKTSTMCCTFHRIKKSIVLFKSAQDALASLNLLPLVFWEPKLRTEALVLLLQHLAFLIFFNNITASVLLFEAAVPF